jgi:hypothetical protein
MQIQIPTLSLSSVRPGCVERTRCRVQLFAFTASHDVLLLPASQPSPGAEQAFTRSCIHFQWQKFLCWFAVAAQERERERERGRERERTHQHQLLCRATCTFPEESDGRRSKAS